MTPNSPDYDSFAWFYNRYWGPEFCRTALAVLKRVLFPKLAPGDRILDLCCGTGQLAAELVSHGYRVTGVDASEGMLEFARMNAPEASFVRGDVRSLDDGVVPEGFDACVSVFDSLNHILSLSELTEVFRRVHSVLAVNSSFVFDLNTEEEFEVGAREAGFDIIEDDHACIVRSRYDARERLKEYQVTTFKLDDAGWERNDVTLLQRYYSIEEVKAALALADFAGTLVYDASRDLGLSVKDERAFFLARKG